MANGQRKDPFRNFRFRVEIDGITQAGFTEALGFDSTIDVVEYREGSDPIFFRKLPGLTRYGNIQLKWGVTDSMELFNWYKEIVAGNVGRKRISIVSVDETGNDKARWEFENAWPCRYDAPDFNAKGTEVAIEEMEITFETMSRTQ